MLSSIYSENCAIHFNKTAYSALNTLLKSATYTKIFILVDENTRRFCLANFQARITGDYTTEIIEIKAGEHYKNIKTCLNVWNVLSEKGADRKSLLIALGGGVVTDLGGFAASTYMRGMDFINVPTSLLGMVDAAIGGKTGVNLGVLKNLTGVINFPKLILTDTSFLKTLPENQLKSGFAEMLKHGLIHSEDYWNKLASFSILKTNTLDAVIHKSIAIKNNVVMQDPGEGHLRKILNYGHTLGHAIESCFLNTKKQVLHGEAIAAGMILATYISSRLTGFPQEKSAHIKATIQSHFSTIHFNKHNYNKIISLLKHDKKNVHGTVNFVLLNDIGTPVLNQTVSEKLIMEAFEYYKN